MSDKSNVMPNNLDAEQALLGCMLIDNEILADVLVGLDKNDFYQESHQYIISAIKIIFEERKPLDIVTLSDRLESEGNLEKAGGISYITELTQITPSAANYKFYLDIVKRDSINRSLIRAARQIAEFSQNSDDTVKSIQFAEEKIYSVSQVNDTSTVKDIRESDGIDKVLDKFEKLSKDKNAFRGVPTGFNMLDRITNGLQKSDLIVIAARPGMGKTSLAMNIVENAAVNNGCVCAVFSLEMPEIQIIQRLLCSTAGVSMSEALSGKLTQDGWIKSRNDGRLDLVMIDYIQLMSSGKNSGDENRTQEVAAITRELKIMAKELDVPVIALSQLRRIQSSEPQLSDLRESGAIEQDADIVMFINRPDVNATDADIEKKNIVKGMAELIIAKHRNGELGRIKLRFRGELTKFVNPELNEEMEARAQNEGRFINRPTEKEELAPLGDADVPAEEEEPPF